MLMCQNNVLHEEDITAIEDTNVRNRAKYLERCKDNLWERWKCENLKGIGECHNLKYGGKGVNISIGDICLINGEGKNQKCWGIGIAKEFIKDTG